MKFSNREFDCYDTHYIYNKTDIRILSNAILNLRACELEKKQNKKIYKFLTFI